MVTFYVIKETITCTSMTAGICLIASLYHQLIKNCTIDPPKKKWSKMLGTIACYLKITIVRKVVSFWKQYIKHDLFQHLCQCRCCECFLKRLKTIKFVCHKNKTLLADCLTRPMDIWCEFCVFDNGNVEYLIQDTKGKKIMAVHWFPQLIGGKPLGIV